MSSGVCYFLCGGHRYLGQLCVSLHSLRRWYDGDVCVLVGDDTDPIPPVCSVWTVPLAQCKRHRHYVTKASLWRHSPFDHTVFLDADTVVTGDISELFRHGFAAVRFSDWVTTGKRISGRLRQWERVERCKEPLTELLATPYPALNTGVMAWNRENATGLLGEWERLTQDGWQCSWTDEYALHFFLPELLTDPKYAVLDDRWNCSPTYGVHRADARIWHWHGRRAVHDHKPTERGLYRPYLLEALDANIGGIRQWLRDVDPALASSADGIAAS